ncbi:MAG: hypothetical protein U1E73_13040 [Planctomycetota bacterium]
MRPRARDEGGFALLVMLGVMAAGSVGILLALQAFVPPLADRQERTDRALLAVRRAACEAYRENGAFPSRLANLASTASGLSSTPCRIDPYGGGNDFGYSTRYLTLRVTSRGADGRSGTSDDQTLATSAEVFQRVRTRARLRILRAVFNRSAYRYSAAMASSGTDAADMLAAQHAYAACKRQWLNSDRTTRTALQAALTAAAATVSALKTHHGLPSLPTSVTGSYGLMHHLGLPDGRAVDGIGQTFALDPVLGFVAKGTDRRWRTNDDM